MIKKTIINIIQKHRRKQLKKCGDNVRISSKCRLLGNICVGNNVVIGEGNYMVSTQATLYIEDNVIFGPNVTIYTGDHPIHIVGRHISDITDDDKKMFGGCFDKDVIIKEGCWIGTGAIILKGVTIGKGCVIGAGALVTKDVPDYSIYTGVPDVRIKKRFTDKEIEQHEKMLRNKD